MLPLKRRKEKKTGLGELPTVESDVPLGPKTFASFFPPVAFKRRFFVCVLVAVGTKSDEARDPP